MTAWQKLRIWIAFLSPSLIIGGIIGFYPGYQLYNWAWKKESFCLTCHVHDYANVGHAQSLHGKVTTCHDCHHQRLRDYMREAYIMLTKPPKFPEDLHHTPYVKKELCAACHISNVADRSTITGPMSYEEILEIPKVDLSHLHNLHLKKTTDLTLINSHELPAEQRDSEAPSISGLLPTTKGAIRPINCADCHGGSPNRGHNFSAADLSCVRCHEEAHKTKLGKEVGCRTCHFHEFMIPKEKFKDPAEKDKNLQKIRNDSENRN